MKMDGIRQRGEMAMGKGPMSGDSFGVKSFGDTISNGKSMGSTDPTILPEGKRCPPVSQSGKLPAQSNPDHGKHHGNGSWGT
jgi:hypothetical protein